jgi:hypothetical protein
MTIWDVLSDFGGILEICIWGTSVVVASTARFYFESSIISKIFLENSFKGDVDDRRNAFSLGNKNALWSMASKKEMKDQQIFKRLTNPTN